MVLGLISDVRRDGTSGSRLRAMKSMLLQVEAFMTNRLLIYHQTKRSKVFMSIVYGRLDSGAIILFGGFWIT